MNKGLNPGHRFGLVLCVSFSALVGLPEGYAVHNVFVQIILKGCGFGNKLRKKKKLQGMANHISSRIQPLVRSVSLMYIQSDH